MTEKYAEKISMLMDDELQGQEASNLIDGIKHDEWLRQCWERYHLVSDALKNNLPTLVKHDLAARLSKALDAEQTYRIIPHRPQNSTATTYFKPVMGLALAASVAVVAFLLAPWEGTTMAPIIPQQQAAMTASIPQLGNAMTAEQVAANMTDGRDQTQQQPAQELKVEPVLYDYLVDHNEYTNAAYVQSSMLPYVRIVGYSGNGKDNP
jgi:sigma-E factor negative regulatory protein RseA